MKRLTGLFIFICILFIITGCKNSEESIFGTYLFENKTQQNLEEIKVIMNDYYTKIDGFIVSQEHQEDSTQKIFTRDELPDIDTTSIDNQQQTVFLNLKAEIDVISKTLDECATFEENKFCTPTSRYYSIKVKSENNQLYIEAYSYRSFPNNNGFADEIRTVIIYMNLIEDQVYFQYVRELNAKTGDLEIQHISYDTYYHDNFMINMYIDHNSKYNYRNIDKSEDEEFLITSLMINNDTLINFHDPSKSFTSSILLNEDLDITQSSIYYEEPLSNLKYMYSNKQTATLTWDLLEVEGWNKIELGDFGSKVYIDDTEILDDFAINIFIGQMYQIINTIDLSENELTQSDLDLSQEGLLFSAISLEKLLQDRMYFEDNYMSVLEDHNFSMDAQDNHTKIKEMIPFESNSSIINEIYEMLSENRS
jgi:hypothetical protein